MFWKKRYISWEIVCRSNPNEHGFIFELDWSNKVGFVGKYNTGDTDVYRYRDIIDEYFDIKKCSQNIARIILLAGKPIVESVISLQEQKEELEYVSRKANRWVLAGRAYPEKSLENQASEIDQQISECKQTLSRLYQRTITESDFLQLDYSLSSSSLMIDKSTERVERVQQLLNAFDEL
ncbi:hypothetical protein C1752_10487 [Acaryochloris thomasi RCC1774]|uniref:Uncharacterized protein n=1 Tax=Acaryochloris thomasi RCC1774 TaxID=1764569 RepID=A0A2W1JP13_9CYAN|nr:hypothetical protein [Acaryochloris thomasi]PZD70637.1 hypothetical protein C1752_10487 [Acaryochloris thomasi RCC1774]